MKRGRCTVASLDFKTKVPAGEFTRCLRITYPIAGGDAGWGERVYAPGIGLIREVYSDEASPWMIALRRSSIPHDVFICHASEDKATVARKLASCQESRLPCLVRRIYAEGGR